MGWDVSRFLYWLDTHVFDAGSLLTKTSSNSASTTFGSSSLVGDGGASVCFVLPLKAATAAITLFGFLVGLGGGSIAPFAMGCLQMSVLARLSVGLLGLLFDGELSLVLSPFPCAFVNGALSMPFFRENVSISDVADLGTCIDFGRSLGVGRFCKDGCPNSKKSRCFEGE
jgi:hypothetical protein